jgi:16S rRNA processing protein RimM
MPKPPAPAGLSGSPSSGEPVYLAVGFLRRPHGVYGDILMEVYTDFPERLQAGTRVFLGEKYVPADIKHIRSHNDGLLIGFIGYETPESVGKLRNLTVYVPTANRPTLPDGRFYHYQLLGVRVVDDAGNELGTLTDIIQTGANDVYVVTSEDGRELLLPAIKDVVLGVDLSAKTITIHLIPGLLDTEE